MDILNSDWLIRMLEKSSMQAQARMLNLFDILDDWLNAPKLNTHLTNTTSTANSQLLTHYLTIQAAKAGAAMPEMLANQLYFMAIAAIHEQLHGKQASSLQHAKQAAHALIMAQTKKETFYLPKKTVYATAASVLAVMLMAGGLYVNSSHQTGKTNIASSQQAPVYASHLPIMQASNAASPEQTAALFARVEQMRKGNCQLIEALQLPDSYRKVYFENVVLGQISTNADEQRLANTLLDKVRCNYSPMLMANSKN
ncbi:MAG TPA: hypothetical protein VGD04_07175 [Methylophilus sp.]